MSKAVDESLQCLFRVSRQSCIVSEEHLPYENLPHFGLSSEVGKVEHAVVCVELLLVWSYTPSSDWLSG